MFLSSSALVAGFFLASANLAMGHAGITHPPIRQPGNAFLKTCGQTSFSSVKGDATGHIEEQEPVTAGCELTLCRGMQFSDQPSSNVQTVVPGQAMSMGVDCTIPHGGPANVSLVDTTVGGSGEIIGSFLKTFSDFCPTQGGTPADQSNLQFTLPSASTVGSKCQKAGDCVVQLFWATPDFSQNYYYCVDVAMNDASSGGAAASAGASSPASAASSGSVAAVPAVAATSAANNAPGSASSAAVSAIASIAPSSSRLITMVSSATNTPQAAAAETSAAQTSGARRRLRILWFYL